jgi:hypothetical protein
MICPNCGLKLEVRDSPDGIPLACPRCHSGVPDPGTAHRLLLFKLIRGDAAALGLVLLPITCACLGLVSGRGGLAVFATLLLFSSGLFLLLLARRGLELSLPLPWTRAFTVALATLLFLSWAVLLVTLFRRD